MRQEVRRFAYMCDGMEHAQKRCNSVQVIDACTEREADYLAAQKGWKISKSRTMCNGKRHFL